MLWSSEDTTKMKKKRKKTPEERAAELAYREDLDRRLQRKIEHLRTLSAQRGTLVEGDLDSRLRQMIERYRRLNSERRAAGGEAW